MKIKSIRNGFANNSSSAHSIVFLGNHKAKSESDGSDYGWDYFTLADEESKKKYLLMTLLHNNFVDFIPHTALTEKVGWINPFDSEQVYSKYDLTRTEFEKSKYGARVEYGAEIIKKIEVDYLIEEYKDIFSKEFIENNMKEGGYIDHQSVIYLPKNTNGTINNKFAKELFSVLINKNFAILGGNDNGGDNHPKKEYSTSSEDESIKAALKVLDFMYSNVICVYDEENDDFILQTTDNGNKIRVSFNSDLKTTKSSIPELIDLKITDNCSYGCTFCYQSSTKEGKHANFENIKKAILMLSNSRTMEIAIGGGEPTTHPDLLAILKEIKTRNMLACFTTKNFKLHERPDFEEILKTANSIAFSCNSVSEIQNVDEIMDAARNIGLYPGSRDCAQFYIQMIPELMSDKMFSESLEFINQEMYDTPVTLLGYKDFGFGEKYKPKNRFKTSEWIDNIKYHSKENSIKFGIDSVLVSKWEKELIEKGVDPMALVGSEGKFSCYLDAVTMKVHKSSFSKEPGIQLTGEENDIKKEFATF